MHIFTVTALALGMLAVAAAEPSFAKGPKDCQGKYQAYQNGQCVNTTVANPNRERQTAVDQPFYKRNKTKKTNHSNSGQSSDQ